MNHLTFDKARQEATVFNSLVRAGVISEDSKLSNDEVVELGLAKLSE